MQHRSAVTISESDQRLKFGVPYGNRARVTAVKEKRFTGIQRKPAAGIAPYGSLRNRYWTLSGPFNERMNIQVEFTKLPSGVVSCSPEARGGSVAT